MRPLINAQEVATLLNVSIPTVYRLAREGELPCVKVGATIVRFRPEDIKHLVESVAE